MAGHAKLSLATAPPLRLIVERNDARRRGLLTYFTGRPCKHGHLCERYTSNHACLECLPLHDYRNSPAWVVAHRQAQRIRNATLRGYAAPPLERNCPPPAADGRCDCCLELMGDRLRLDHDHITGEFRGWCCDGCNTGTALSDNATKLRLRADYLDKKLPWQ